MNSLPQRLWPFLSVASLAALCMPLHAEYLAEGGIAREWNGHQTHTFTNNGEIVFHRAGTIELGIVDGMILPNLKMDGVTDACPFLDENGRCSVHACRPGLCRLFPLGRYYEENGFRYFIQIHECRKKDRGKVKIRKWLGIPDLKSYERYILRWHDFLNECEAALETLDEEKRRILTLYVLRSFYETAYMVSDDHGFYEAFDARMGQVREKLGMAEQE